MVSKRTQSEMLDSIDRHMENIERGIERLLSLTVVNSGGIHSINGHLMGVLGSQMSMLSPYQMSEASGYTEDLVKDSNKNIEEYSTSLAKQIKRHDSGDTAEKEENND